LLEGTSVGTGLFVVDLELVAAEEGGDPVGGTWDEGYAAADADIGTGVVDRKGAGWDAFRVVAREVRPLERKFAVGQPVGQREVTARADLGVPWVSARKSFAVAGVALTLDDIFSSEKRFLSFAVKRRRDALDDGHLDETPIMVVPPPFERDILSSLERILRRDCGHGVFASIVVTRHKRIARVISRTGREHIGMCHRR